MNIKTIWFETAPLWFGLTIILMVLYFPYTIVKFNLEMLEIELPETYMTYNVPQELPEAQIIDISAQRFSEATGVPLYHAYLTIWYESRGDQFATGFNKNSRDYGLWQINSVHGYSLKCLYDWKCNTKKAIDIFNQRSKTGQNGLCAWYGARKAGLITC